MMVFVSAFPSSSRISSITSYNSMLFISDLTYSCLFVCFCATAPSGPGPHHSYGL
jgi:hypothetical protein